MLFVLDVGNTNTVLGVFEGDQLKHQWRIKTDRYKTEDEFGMLVKSLFDHKGITLSDMKGIIISSVVPPIMFALEKMCKDYFHLEPMIIGKESVHSFLKMRYPNPREIGADRIVNAVGAIETYGAPLIIIDFGTATTFCYINDQQEYHGGVISPGINISMEALYSKASKLPKIEIQAPDHVVGSSTVEAMQSGVFYGYVGQVDGIVRRIEAEMGVNAKVVATGGLASLIAHESQTIQHVDPYLTLKGLYLIYHKNKQL
ncbi:MAG: type III pantothenate kinase [Bacillota bacterium]|uniref:Type III pantothenate kinase n=1 Tax=Virgibacillus salarius TaxID=447199 RepID=A0A941DVK2_9BACI|nr:MULTISPECIES: type III pantothenate kinase [Virgibacillus]NAZ10279.1 type III pantothenate kinase [Agaribacter marinus]MBR7797570.1 type III pantothenate kinase [Virgibacillus salarius]MCC2251846.1 type III pantothenate kinase [Virgibacillus sp. AGTR]MDY7046141.1 type III pantothenate kinase [Virgibacillus sp. M23]QRZ19113.1 type III pantothenate kinase [Virgibacillus sp. AGTR]